MKASYWGSILTVSAVTVTGLLLLLKLRNREDEKNVSDLVDEERLSNEEEVKPTDIDWIDEKEFKVLSSLMATILPPFDVEHPDFENALRTTAKRYCLPSDIEISKEFKDIFKCSSIQSNSCAVSCRVLEDNKTAGELEQLKTILKLIDTPIFCFLLTLSITPFSQLTFKYKEKVLQRWRDSGFSALRLLYQTVKRLATTPFAGKEEEERREGKKSNAVWRAIDYEVRDEEEVRTLKEAFNVDESYCERSLGVVEDVDQLEEEEMFDAIIVGSTLNFDLLIMFYLFILHRKWMWWWNRLLYVGNSWNESVGAGEGGVVSGERF